MLNNNLFQDLKCYLDSSKNGVIYTSFGTNVNTHQIPPEVLKKIVKVLSEVPYDVLLKWNEDDLPGRTDNIRISKWFPQSDLLRKCILKFISFINIVTKHKTIYIQSVPEIRNKPQQGNRIDNYRHQLLQGFET